MLLELVLIVVLRTSAASKPRSEKTGKVEDGQRPVLFHIIRSHRRLTTLLSLSLSKFHAASVKEKYYYLSSMITMTTRVVVILRICVVGSSFLHIFVVVDVKYMYRTLMEGTVQRLLSSVTFMLIL